MMNNPEQIKQVLTPIMVAQHYLEQGITKGNRVWYKSPFRNERTPSFMVDNKSFHDFGDSWHGDVIDFVGRYYNTNFINAMKILSRDFGLPEDEPISRELEQYLIRKREEEKQMKMNLDEWFYNTYNEICDKLWFWRKVIPILKQEGLQKAYFKRTELEFLWEAFFEAINDEDKKLKLWIDKEGIEKCLK